MNRRVFATLLTIVTSAGLLAGCSENPGSADRTSLATTALTGTLVLARNSNGPAPAVPGAHFGGTITVLGDPLVHLDPARVNTADGIWADGLITRALTTVVPTASGGSEVLGDLATNTGEPSDGNRTWTYVLKSGLEYEDGAPVTAADVVHGIARTFAPELAGGLTYLQAALANRPDYSSVYSGPFDGRGVVPPGVQTPDSRTIVFHFATPQPYMPYLARWATPVPASKDNVRTYDSHPLATGPYMVASWQPGQLLTLVRNPRWSAATDPARHQYPSTIVFDGRPTRLAVSERLIADQGSDRSAIAASDVATSLIPTVLNDRGLATRTIQGQTGGMVYLFINTRRVTDVKVRQALAYAINRDALVKFSGGPAVVTPATTIISPVDAGFHQYNAYDGGATGNTAKAAELLDGRQVPLTMAVPAGSPIGTVVQEALQPAGFQITPQPIPATQYSEEISAKDNPFDLYLSTWVPTWPDGGHFIDPLLDGNLITQANNSNLSLFDDPTTNAAIERIWAMSDARAQAAGWAALDQQVMRTEAPLIPMYSLRFFTLVGSDVGGAVLDPGLGLTSLNSVYVR